MSGRAEAAHADRRSRVRRHDPHGRPLVLLRRDHLNHPIPRLYPEKTFVYSDDDVFAPLLPGVYASASRGRFFSINRMESQRFIDWLNPSVQSMQAEKRYLFSFSRRSSSLLRKRLFRTNFRRADVLVEETSSYNHWIVEADREENQRRYVTTLAASRFRALPQGCQRRLLPAL